MGLHSIAMAAAPIVGSALQYRMDKRAAERSRGWKERMSNSAHQREARDLEAAGLNRILGYTGGGGATTPGDSAARTPDIAKIASTALQARRLQKEIDVMSADILQKTAAANLSDASAKGIIATMGKTVEQTALTKVEVRLQKLLYKQAAATGNSIAGRNLWSAYRAGKITWESVENKIKSWFKNINKKGHKKHGSSKSTNKKAVRPKAPPTL